MSSTIKMKQVMSTLNVFLRQEWISVIVYIIATILFMFMIFTAQSKLDMKGNVQVDPIDFALLLISMLSIFIGLYLGSGFIRLQQSHLWKTHQHYRINLISSLIIAAMLYGSIQLVALLKAHWPLSVALIVPTCVTLLTAQMMIARHWIMKIIFPASPFILFQFVDYQTYLALTLLALLLITFIALYLTATNYNKPKSPALGLMSGNIKAQMKSPSVQKLNHFSISIFKWLGKIKPNKMSSNKVSSNKDFSIALLQPSNRYGIFSSLIAICTLLLLSGVGNTDKLQVEVFTAMILGSMILSQFMDLQLLAKQSKPFSHLYSSRKHESFKQHVVKMVQKHTFFQGFNTLIALLILSFFLNDFAEPLLLIKMGFSIILVASSFIPLMLCLDWFKVNVKLIIVVLIYTAVGFVFCGWQYEHQLIDLISLEGLLLMAALALIRWLSIRHWNKQPLEVFMRTYG